MKNETEAGGWVRVIDSAELRLRTYPILAEGGGLFIRMGPKGEADE